MSTWLKIKEGGTLFDRTKYLDLTNPPTFTLQRGQRGTATISLHMVATDSYAPTLGTQIYLYEVTNLGSKGVFAGSIDTITLDWNSDSGDRRYALSCVAFEQCFDTIFISPRTYAAGTACGTVFTDILSDVCFGVPVTNGTISAGSNLAGDLVLNFSRPSDVFDTLAQDSGFIWYVDPDALTINFRAATSPAAPFTLAESSVLWGTLEWEQTRQDFRNRQVIRRAFEADNPSADYFVGDGTTKIFNLSYEYAKGVLAFTTQDTIASATGTMTGVPAPGDTVSIQGDPGFWVTTLDNTSGQAQIKIGADYLESVGNLINSINANPDPTIAGVLFNLPTSEQGATNAGGNVLGVFTLRAKYPGTLGNSIALASTGTAFSWSGSTLSGGTGTGTGNTALNIVENASSDVPSDPADVNCTVGSKVITFATAPASGHFVSFAYYRVGSDCVQVEDTPLVLARAAIESGTGKYQQEIDDTQNANNANAFQKAVSALNFYKTLPQQFSFESDNAGLIPGQVLTVAIAAAPVFAPGLLNGNWVVQQIQGDLIPGVDFLKPGGGHFRYTITVINATVIGTDIQFWQQLAGGGSGGSSIGGGGGGGGGSTDLNQITVSTTPYAVTASNDVITFIAGSSVANLPSLALQFRKPLWLINASSGSITVNPFAGDTTEGLPSITLTPGARFQLMPNA